MKRVTLIAMWGGALATAYLLGRLSATAQSRPGVSPFFAIAKQRDATFTTAPSRSELLPRLWQQIGRSVGLQSDFALREAMLQAWARENPAEALAVAASLPHPQCDEAREIVLEAWLVHDFASALAWINGNAHAFLFTDRFVVAAAAAGRFREAALALRVTPRAQSKDQWWFERNFEALASAWSKRDPVAAFAWLSSLPAEERKLATLGYVATWAKRAPREAAEWSINSSPQSEEVRDAVYRTMQSWVESGDLAAPTAWIEQRRDDPRLDTSRVEVAHAYARRNDVDSAERLLQQIRDPRYTGYYAFVASSLIARHSPVNAVRLAELIPDSANRSEAIGRYVERWWAKDPSGAIDYLHRGASSLTPQERTALLAKFQRATATTP